MAQGNARYFRLERVLLAQVITLVERVLKSDRIQYQLTLGDDYDLRRHILLMLNMNRIVQHIWETIRQKNTE